MRFSQGITRKAFEAGFIAVGFCRSGPPPFLSEYHRWIEGGKYGEMEWLQRHRALKADPENVLKGCNTVISLAYPYPSRKPRTADGLTAARYARPGSPDYHAAIKAKAEPLLALLFERYPQERSRVCVDSAPLLERGFAYASGIGFIGKNNMLIRPGHGSYFFLAEILTTATFPLPEQKPLETLCGTCSRCVDACPTGALEKPFSLDAGKCLSYLTIEKRGAIDSETGKRMGTCFFGCDVCQEVCPFNPDSGGSRESLPASDSFLRMNEATFGKLFGKSAFARAGLEKIKSNITAMRQGG